MSYETPVPVPGAVSVALEAQGGITPFYADGIKYYNADTNAGYEGDLEMALIPDSFRETILGEVRDTNEVLVENAEVNGSEFALGFQIDGDEKGTRFWFYNCTATRPSTESSTTEDTKEPTTDTITISCAADMNGDVRVKTSDDTSAATYDDWFDAVYIKTV